MKIISANITGSLTVSGPSYGNVVSMSVASSTASLDFSKGSFFTLTLPASATTHISASNIQPGLSAALVLTIQSASTASFNSLIKQPSGSSYVASASGSTDILSFITFGSTAAYSTSVLNLI
jgi:hypothetical protein